MVFAMCSRMESGWSIFITLFSCFFSCLAKVSLLIFRCRGNSNGVALGATCSRREKRALFMRTRTQLFLLNYCLGSSPVLVSSSHSSLPWLSHISLLLSTSWMKLYNSRHQKGPMARDFLQPVRCYQIPRSL